jgi:P-type Ca2+ transporter type 2C
LTSVPDVHSTSAIEPYRLPADQVAAGLGVDPASGLAPAEAAERLEQYGPNRLEDAKARPKWKRFLDQFRDVLIIILLVAAVVAFVVSGDVKTPIVILVVVILNAILGYVQQNKAEASLEALKKMLQLRSKVRRGGQMVEVDADEIVPGDVVLVEAGDRIPADGRLSMLANLEVEEAALTGESQPVAKDLAAIDREGLGIGDRLNSVYKNTTVTRGRAEFVVTGTGMETEIGKIAGLLRAQETQKTPLQIQLDHLGHTLAKLAGVIVALVFAIGLVRGEDVGELFLTAVALAVASIPEGLPAVVAVTLAIGASKMAKQNAIVKQLAAVETLGATSVICSDKTGTLTLNQMTARAVIYAGRTHEVTGEGYEPNGQILGTSDEDPGELDLALMPMALCSDAVVRDGELVGDPTEGALVTLAAKGGIDAAAARQRHPRLAEVPFDSATKYMATFHAWRNESGQDVVRMYVKGAPDVVAGRATRVMGPARVPGSLSSSVLEVIRAENAALADEGLRVLAVAHRDFKGEVFQEFVDEGGDLSHLCQELVFLALIGIVDPPRPEAKAAIDECKSAGIQVKMITGDHASTAAAIGHELGLDGEAVSGADLDRMSDAELVDRIDAISVFARVAPSHKLELVKALQREGNVVAMTGDGVNDAPALKAADIGVAMGITGTEVSKEAATMVLTDDNFTTIVRAVKNGRSIYDNIVKFIKFQLSTTIGFAFTFLVASIFNIAGGKPFTAIQILWVNLIMDGPPAMALGVDPPAGDVMDRKPRRMGEQILNPSRLSKIVFYAVIMGVGTLAVLQLAPGEAAKAGEATVAGTMAFTTFVLFQFFNILNTRDDTRSAFSRYTFTNRWLWYSLIGVLVLQVLVVQVPLLQRLFDTAGLTPLEWVTCIAVASSVLWLEEIRKAVVRMRLGARPSVAAA